jgi:hypothetical protein
LQKTKKMKKGFSIGKDRYLVESLEFADRTV